MIEALFEGLPLAKFYFILGGAIAVVGLLQLALISLQASWFERQRHRRDECPYRRVP